ncbi:MAG: isoprenoid biosynthesis protein ElbB [Bdellovibrionales bacterium GWA2_49_15]|nr:MAG: isoprenoid biosynthesis protein ElbB [Bdellovibrionales bacterium GWA2_49_15]HAZ14030.1 isoprenoid biosynthesis protein ElbB [Bdellovibrionales bacterium]
MKKIGVILAGCGNRDGAEIREAVFTLLAIDKLGAEAVIMAPNLNQHHVISHLSGNELQETRNILEESARIARGNIQDITKVRPDSLDALILPGGYGVAKNLCKFAFDGSKATVLPEVKVLVNIIHQQQKPIGAICIAPALIALLFGQEHIRLTIGSDPDTAQEIEKTGAKHVVCAVDQICADQVSKIVTTPAYMYSDAKLHEMYAGIEKCVAQVLAWA